MQPHFSIFQLAINQLVAPKSFNDLVEFNIGLLFWKAGPFFSIVFTTDPTCHGY